MANILPTELGSQSFLHFLPGTRLQKCILSSTIYYFINLKYHWYEEVIVNAWLVCFLVNFHSSWYFYFWWCCISFFAWILLSRFQINLFYVYNIYKQCCLRLVEASSKRLFCPLEIIPLVVWFLWWFLDFWRHELFQVDLICFLPKICYFSKILEHFNPNHEGICLF